MIAKTFEVRDAGTFIPALAVKLEPGCEADRYLLARAGFGTAPDTQKKYVFLCRLNGGPGYGGGYDPHAWPGSTRTLSVAHKYIIEHFDALESGAVVDVEFILGLKPEPKRSETWA